MSGSFTQTIVVGNLGQDPEVRFMPQGGQVCTLSIATSETWNDKQTGQKQERTEWHRVVFFNRLAEICGQYLNKGSKILVIGKNRTRKWQDANGNDRYTTEIVGKEMQMLSTGQRGGQPGGYQNQQHQGAQYGQQQGHQQTGYPEGTMPPPMDMGDIDDDIPF